MESISAVTGPSTMGARGVPDELADLDGSIRIVGWVTPLATSPEALIIPYPVLLDVPGPALRKPPSMLPPMMMALLDSGLPPRLLTDVVPVSEIEPMLIKDPPEELGQGKPDGAPISLAQEWMPPRVWMPIMPAPTPERLG